MLGPTRGRDGPRRASPTREVSMMNPDRRSRRSFLRTMAAAPAVATVPLGGKVYALARPAAFEPPPRYGPNDKVRIATIGMGIIGFIDTETALKVPGVE